MNKEQIHDFRKQIDGCIKIAEEDLDLPIAPGTNYKREIALVRTKLQEAKMWAGKCLEAFPDNDFPESLKDESKTAEIEKGEVREDK